MTTSSFHLDRPAGAIAPHRSRLRRRLMLLACVVLAGLGAALALSFTASTGTVTPTVLAASRSKLVFVQESDLPSSQVLTFRVSAIQAAVNDRAPTAPVWTPVVGRAGTITQKGDLAIVDARTSSAGGATSLTISIHVTNMAALQSTYSSFSFPVRIYQGLYDDGAPTSSPIGDLMVWETSGTLVADSAGTYLTNTNGFLTFRVPTRANNEQGNVLAIQLGEDGAVDPANDTGDGGSFYTICASGCDGGTLDPRFYIEVQPS